MYGIILEMYNFNFWLEKQARGRDIFAYQQAIRRSMGRGTLPLRIMKSPFTTKFGSIEPKKEKLELNSERFEGPTFKLLFQGL